MTYKVDELESLRAQVAARDAALGKLMIDKTHHGLMAVLLQHGVHSK